MDQNRRLSESAHRPLREGEVYQPYVPAGETQNELFISALKEGNYEFEFSVTDEKGASATDLVNVIVNPIPPDNIPPIADAGENIINLNPNDQYVHVGTGYDEDGFVVAYQWTLIDGPIINNFKVNSDTLLLQNLEPGESRR